MQEIGRRIIFDTATGKIIMDTGEMQGSDGSLLPREPINGLDYIDLPYGQDSDKFNRVKSYHVNPETKEIVFDEFYNPVQTPEQRISELENQLLIEADKNIGGIL
ncbi:hypothetical protein [Clostridium sp.]|uniref:hypothetical protein n=1 Tax=Clostridium sp. TaxID=1506 RepID=UPI0035A13D9C